MRIVLDVNVLVSGIATGDTAPALTMDQWANGAFDLILSDHIFDGVAGAFRKPYWKQRYGDDLVDAYMDHLRSEAVPVIPADTVRGVAEDLEDDLVLATAVAGRAYFLVTGDRVLREIGEYGGVRIVTPLRVPREFLDILDDPLLADPGPPW